ncbi:MAG TPA: hypothetical protein ENN63_05070 [Bacteroidetes bacterium]|nr:hypothetical protein [Bacteroidota bacterium]
MIPVTMTPTSSPAISTEEKRRLARTILREAKEEVLNILWDTDPNEYCNERLMLVWLEEDYEYAIRRLGLCRRSESSYLQKLHRIFGQYSEVIPECRKTEHLRSIQRS